MANPVLGVSGSAPLSNPYLLESRYLTRHGIIAGSTGTGKSRAMQLLAEQLADDGVDVFVSDVKGDASGFCLEGKESERNEKAPFRPHAIKTNYWSASPELARMRFSLLEVGPVLFSRLLELNSTQESHLSLAFSYSRKNRIALDTIEDLLSVLDSMVAGDERGISKSSVSVIERKLLSLQESGLDAMFGKPSVSLDDLKGMNVLNLSDSRKNMLVSIAPAFLLQKLFNELPEVGDVEIPRFAIFFDEAHYLFHDANRTLRDLIVTMLKQIRSKGVSVFFVSQDVGDLPDEVLSQLGTKIIFAQRIATAKGETALRALSKSFPKSPDLDIIETLKTLPPGTALVTTLDSGGNQTKPEKVVLFAPATTMEVVDYKTLREETDPALLQKYGREATRAKQAAKGKPEPVKEIQKKSGNPGKTDSREAKAEKKGPGIWDAVFSFLLKLLDFLIKAIGKLVNAMIIKPLQGFFKWIFKKPVRILYFLAFLLLLYIIFANWPLIAKFLASLRFS
jgi:hypothetical protein